MKTVQAETDVAAAREEFLALGTLASGAADEALFSAARRLESKLDNALAWSVALRGPDALALTKRLHDATKGVEWRRFFSWATREGRESWPSAGEAALALEDSEPWRGLLALSLDSGRAIDDATLAKAVQSSGAGLRTETYWHLFRLLDRDAKPGTAVGASPGWRTPGQGGVGGRSHGCPGLRARRAGFGTRRRRPHQAHRGYEPFLNHGQVFPWLIPASSSRS